MVMDNFLAAHKAKRACELVEARGGEALFLTPYSPNLNPLEEAFGKVKAMLRGALGSQARGAGRSDGPGALEYNGR